MIFPGKKIKIFIKYRGGGVPVGGLGPVIEFALGCELDESQA